MEKIEISQEMVKMRCTKMPNWDGPGKDGVQGYWLKNLTYLHPHIAVQINHILDDERPLSDWMTFGYCATKTWQRAVQLIITDQYPACS